MQDNNYIVNRVIIILWIAIYINNVMARAHVYIYVCPEKCHKCHLIIRFASLLFRMSICTCTCLVCAWLFHVFAYIDICVPVCTLLYCVRVCMRLYVFMCYVRVPLIFFSIQIAVLSSVLSRVTSLRIYAGIMCTCVNSGWTKSEDDSNCKSAVRLHGVETSGGASFLN